MNFQEKASFKPLARNNFLKGEERNNETTNQCNHEAMKQCNNEAMEPFSCFLGEKKVQWERSLRAAFSFGLFS
jgi:hypothetical protein